VRLACCQTEQRQTQKARFEVKIGKLYPSKYLKAADIPNGRDLQRRIDVVQLERMEQTGEEKPVLSFIGESQGLVMNKTNAGVLAAALGDESDSLHGAAVALFVVPTQKGPGIRLRVTAPPALVAAEDSFPA
jgi:hypothetical protein